MRWRTGANGQSTTITSTCTVLASVCSDEATQLGSLRSALIQICLTNTMTLMLMVHVVLPDTGKHSQERRGVADKASFGRYA